MFFRTPLRRSLSVLSLLGALALPLHGSELAQNEVAVTILPLGDSITAGRISYRYPLIERLEKEGYRVRFVGSRVSRMNPNFPQVKQLHHEGYGGKDVQFLAERIQSVYPEHPADIVLLHAGHNQFADRQPIPGVIASTREIIETLRKTNPKVTILLAQVIPSGKLPKYSYIPELNQELAKLGAELDTPAQRVVVVNQEEGFDWRVDTRDDRVHPNEQGAKKMADRWYEALVLLLPKRA